MFIESRISIANLAPEERDVLACPNISLLWSFQILCMPISINISSLRD